MVYHRPQRHRRLLGHYQDAVPGLRGSVPVQHHPPLLLHLHLTPVLRQLHLSNPVRVYEHAAHRPDDAAQELVHSDLRDTSACE